MQRWKLTLEYDGLPFCGWQHQPGKASVQSVLQEAIRKFSGEEPQIHVAGRTDAGVHAAGQVAHIDLERDVDAMEIQGALNFHLKPHPVAVLKVEAVSDDFHARHAAVMRHYRYRLINRRAPLALDLGRAWHVPLTLDGPLDTESMHLAAQHLLGHHDFTTFRAADCQAKSPLRSISSFAVTRTGDTISFDVSARSFLHHQVRNMVGTLVLVGRGKWQADDVRAALEACDRAAGGPTAPPDGLTFMQVDY